MLKLRQKPKATHPHTPCTQKQLSHCSTYVSTNSSMHAHPFPTPWPRGQLAATKFQCWTTLTIHVHSNLHTESLYKKHQMMQTIVALQCATKRCCNPALARQAPPTGGVPV